MSTSIDYIVDIDATLAEAPELAQRVLDELLRRGIVLSTPQGHHLFDDGPRYATGPNVNIAADVTSREVFPCGLDILIERAVYDAGDNGLNSISCPMCRRPCDLDAEDWVEAVGAWCEGLSGALICNACQHSASIADWQFEPEFGFGNLAFAFSEWMLREDFVPEISQLLGHRVRWVKCHI